MKDHHVFESPLLPIYSYILKQGAKLHCASTLAFCMQSHDVHPTAINISKRREIRSSSRLLTATGSFQRTGVSSSSPHFVPLDETDDTFLASDCAPPPPSSRHYWSPHRQLMPATGEGLTNDVFLGV
jgi:hypothetical protein